MAAAITMSVRSNDILVVCGEAVRVATFHHTMGGYLAAVVVERLEAAPGDEVKWWCLDLTEAPLQNIAEFPTFH